MFERILLENAANGRRKPWTIACSVFFHCLIIGMAVLTPLVYTTGALQTRLPATLVGLFPVPPPAGGRVDKPSPHVKAPPSELLHGQLLAPSQIPDKVDSIVDESPPDGPIIVAGPFGVPGGIPGGSGLGGLFDVIGSRPIEPRPVVPSPRTGEKIKVGGDVQHAKIISQPKPVYPEWAKRVHLSGTVRLAAIISEAGAIEELRVLQGHPLLAQAAVDAVQQWRYRPTFLNGVPVKVETTIDVIFTLSQ